jgi:hypothetical protein
MPCASAMEASGRECAGGGTSRYLYLSTLPPSVAGWKEGSAVLHCKFWVPAFVPKWLAVGLPKLRYLTNRVGWVAVARIESCDTADGADGYQTSHMSKGCQLYQLRVGHMSFRRKKI